MNLSEKYTGGNRYAKVVAKPVIEALKGFCQQSQEFEKMVAEGGSLNECLETICKGIKDSCSDIEVYRRAVQFFCKGANVRFKMEIEMPQEEKAEQTGKPEGNVIFLNLEDFL